MNTKTLQVIMVESNNRVPYDGEIIRHPHTDEWGIYNDKGSPAWIPYHMLWVDPTTEIKVGDWYYNPAMDVPSELLIVKCEYEHEAISAMKEPRCYKIVASTAAIGMVPAINQSDIQWCIDTGAKTVTVEMWQKPYKTGIMDGGVEEVCYEEPTPVVRNGYIIRAKWIPDTIKQKVMKIYEETIMLQLINCTIIAETKEDKELLDKIHTLQDYIRGGPYISKKKETNNH